MLLNCADEVFRYIGGTFQKAFNDPTLGPQLTRSHLRLRFGFVDPDCVLFIDTDRREVRLGGDPDGRPSAMVAMAADTANSYCQGRLDFARALACGDIAADGVTQDLLQLVPELPRLYADVLRSAGREDLLVA